MGEQIAPGTGINVGDAVLRFIADTTQLDSAVAGMGGRVKANLGPTEKAVDDLASAWGVAGRAASEAGDRMATAPEIAAAEIIDLRNRITVLELELKELGNRGKEAGEKLAFSMREAKGELAFMTEMGMPRMSRHLRGFVAEIPGVGAALNAAFSFTAGLLLIQYLVEAGEKVKEFYESLSVLSAEEKRQQEETLKAAKEHLAVETKQLEAEYAIRIAKADGIERERLKLEMQAQLVSLNKDYVGTLTAQRDKVQGLLNEEQKRLGAAAGLTAELSKGTGATMGMAAAGQSLMTVLSAGKVEGGRKNIEALKKELEDATAALKHAEAKAIEDKKTLGKQASDAIISSGESELSAQKRVADARLALDLASIQRDLAEKKIGYAEAARLAGEAHEAAYQAELKRMNDLAALLARDPARNAGRVREVNAQIEAATTAHATALLATYTKLVNLAAAEIGRLKTVEQSLPDAIPLGEMGDKVEEFNRLLDSLGIKGAARLGVELQKAQADYRQMQASGMAATSDLLQMHMKVLQAQIAYNAALGKPHKEAEQELQKLQAEYDKLTGAIGKATKQESLWHQQWGRDLTDAATRAKAFGQIADAAFLGLGNAFASAVASAELSQESFGKAMEKATAQVLAQISAQAAVLALFEVAKALAALAALDVPGATAHFAAAAEFGAVAAVTGAAAWGLSKAAGSGTSQSSGAASSGAVVPVADSSPGAQPVIYTNAPRFAGGALVTAPTLAVVGDRKGGGAAREAVLPLDDPDAMDAIAGAVASRIGGAGTKVYIDGVISADNLVAVMKQMNAQVEKNNVPLAASHARRVVRK